MTTRLLVVLTLALGVAAPRSARAQQTESLEKGGKVSAAQRLADLDTRRPLPLVPMMANHQKENMRDHLLAIQETLGALAARDFAAARRSASRLGSSPQTAQMCSHMGAAAPGFSEKAMSFHHTADRIVAAAERKDLNGALRAVSETLETCNSCHSTFRQEIVDEATWEEATRSTPASPPAGDQP